MIPRKPKECITRGGMITLSKAAQRSNIMTPDCVCFVFLFFSFFFFIFRLRGREEQRERNVNVWLPLTRSLLGT